MITIWGTSTCVWCKRAIKLCEDYKLSYAYRLIDNQEKLAELQESLQEVAPGATTVPQIFWNGKYIGGYVELAQEIENTRNYGDGEI